MQRFLVVGLIFSLVSPTVAFAQGSVRESASRAALQLGQQSQVERPNATKARRVVTDLGVAEHVVVFGFLVKEYGSRGGCGQAAAQAPC